MDKKKSVPPNKATTRDKSQQRLTPSNRQTVLPKVKTAPLMAKLINRIRKQQPNTYVLQALVPVQTTRNDTRAVRSESTHTVCRGERSVVTSRVAMRLPTTPTGNLASVTPLVQNCILIWADDRIDESNEDCREILGKLRTIVNSVHTFTDVDECIEFVKSIKDVKILLVTSNAAGRCIVPEIHAIAELDSCFLLVANKNQTIQWSESLSKVKGVYNDIDPLCQALKQSLLDCEHDMMPISFLPSVDDILSRDLNELGPSFMYTTILKEILLQIDFNAQTMEEFIVFCRETLAGNKHELAKVDKVQQEYNRHTAIWWYTNESFMYSMLNRALRIMDVNIIVKMGFFIRDLHRHLEELHREQFTGEHQTRQFTVYRGQGLSQPDFENICKSKGGLISFDSFLSTSPDRNTALHFARRSLSDPITFAVLFVMKIDPSISSTPFADISNSSYFSNEKELLFSMNAVFRIGNIHQMRENNHLFQVELVLTSDSDPNLKTLTDRIREETEESTGWLRLGRLLLRLEQFEKAEQIYEMLLKNAANDSEKVTIYNQLGLCKESSGKYAEAVESYEKAQKHLERLVPSDDSALATLYNNLGAVYECMGQYPKALSYHLEALEIRQKIVPQNPSDLAQSYNNIGAVYYQLEEYPEALASYEKALDIFQNTLPANHPSLATAYSNIGSVYDSLKAYEDARSYYEKALKIDERSLTSDHPHLATSFNNLGLVHDNMGEFAQALTYHERALAIYQRVLPSDHPDLASSYDNIGRLYDRMGDPSRAASYSERAVNIAQHVLPADHPHLLQARRNLEATQKRR